jgi:hypothetical protein
MTDLDRALPLPPGASTFYRLAADQLIAQDFGSVLGIDNVGGMPPLDLQAYRLLLNSVDEYRRNIIAQRGGRCDRRRVPRFSLPDSHNGGRLPLLSFYPGAPRAYLVRSVINVPDEDTAATDRRPDFDYWATAVVTGRTRLGTGFELTARKGGGDRPHGECPYGNGDSRGRTLLVVVDADYGLDSTD